MGRTGHLPRQALQRFRAGAGLEDVTCLATLYRVGQLGDPGEVIEARLKEPTALILLQSRRLAHTRLDNPQTLALLPAAALTLLVATGQNGSAHPFKGKMTTRDKPAYAVLWVCIRRRRPGAKPRSWPFTLWRKTLERGNFVQHEATPNGPRCRRVTRHRRLRARQVPMGLCLRSDAVGQVRDRIDEDEALVGRRKCGRLHTLYWYFEERLPGGGRLRRKRGHEDC